MQKLNKRFINSVSVLLNNIGLKITWLLSVSLRSSSRFHWFQYFSLFRVVIGPLNCRLWSRFGFLSFWVTSCIYKDPLSPICMVWFCSLVSDLLVWVILYQCIGKFKLTCVLVQISLISYCPCSYAWTTYPVYKVESWIKGCWSFVCLLSLISTWCPMMKVCSLVFLFWAYNLIFSLYSASRLLMTMLQVLPLLSFLAW